MSKFNRNLQVPVHSPVRTTGPSGTTALGGPAWERDPQSALFLLGVSLMGMDKSFHEGADARAARFRDLTVQVAASDPGWIAGFLPYLRTVIGMRTASLVMAAEAAHALDLAGQPGARALASSALQRADEPAELLAYWHSRWGRKLPHGVARGVADAVFRLYTERAFLKPEHDPRDASIRMADVIEIVRPRYSRRLWGTWRDDLYGHMIAERHKRAGTPPESLPLLRARHQLIAAAAADPRALLDAGALARAGVSWQEAKSLAGRRVPARELWEALVPSMGYLALLRNLRNLDQAGVSDEVAASVAARLADPVQARASRVLPFQFVAAHRAVTSYRWAHCLERGLGHALSSVPELRGHWLILVDRSPSMWDQKMSDKSGMTWADAAAVFGATIALRAQKADLAEFHGHSRAVPFSKDDPVLRVTERFRGGSGTDIPSAVRQHLRPHHTGVAIITDEQTSPGYLPSNMHRLNGMPSTPIDDLVPRHVPVYLWNFGGYSQAAMPAGQGQRHALGGLSDHAFRVIPILQRQRDATWDDLFATASGEAEAEREPELAVA